MKKKYSDIFTWCFNFAQHFMEFPKGQPALYQDSFPSEHFASENNAADSNYNNYRIVINKAWAEKSIKENRTYEIEFHFFHELRHLYQRSTIERFYATGMAGAESKEDIERWNKNYHNYIRYDGVTKESEESNMTQPIEEDANAYAMALLNLMHFRGSMELSIGLPELTSDLYYKYTETRPELNREMVLANQTNYLSFESQKKHYPNDPCPCGSGQKYKKCKCPEYHEQYA